jgi:SAM-dependent methyltransferase
MSQPLVSARAPALAAEVSWQGHSGTRLDSANGIDVIECLACGFRHIVPIPSEADIDALYRRAYYAEEKPLYMDRQREDGRWWDLVYRERYETFEALLPPGRRRVLDVGCGPGFFLAFVKSRGWDGTGVEPSEQAARHAKSLGIAVIEAPLTARVPLEAGSFDVVHLYEVLEHLSNPPQALELAHRALAPAGLLSVVVPNDYSPIQRAFRDQSRSAPWWVAPPHHVNYFDFESLERLLARAGFEPVLRDATFPIDWFLLMGDRYIDDDQLGRACHGRRMRFELALDAAGLGPQKRRLYRAFAAEGVGREAVVVARRKDQSG